MSEFILHQFERAVSTEWGSALFRLQMSIDAWRKVVCQNDMDRLDEIQALLVDATTQCANMQARTDVPVTHKRAFTECVVHCQALVEFANAKMSSDEAVGEALRARLEW